MAARPHLPWHRRPLRRGVTTVQLGLAPDAPVIHGIDSGDLAILRHLDGAHTRDALGRIAADHGLPTERVDDLIAILDAHGVLTISAPDRLACWRREHARVLVGGDGPDVALVARALTAAGVGQVEWGEWCLDDALALNATLGVSEAHRPPDLVILVASGLMDPARAAPWRERGVSHLAVSHAGEFVTVGPLVPGRGLRRASGVEQATPDLVCVGCVELHLCDADPFRPTLLTQTQPAGSGTAAPVSPDVLPLAVAVTTMIAVAALDQRPLPIGVTLDLGGPWPRIEYRRWAAHPHCACRGSGPTTQPSREQMSPEATPRETMAQ